MGFCNLSELEEAASGPLSEIAAASGVDVKECYQCGKCAAGCPVAASADVDCRGVIRLLQIGDVDRVLKLQMPWLCLSCGVCLARCPQNIDLPALNTAICRYEMKRGIAAEREGEAFMNIFLDNVEAKGVSDETMLAMRYNLQTGHLFQDVANSPRMLSRGLLSGDGYKPAGAPDVKRMVHDIRKGEGGAE
ncbi:MAG: 4Fe-4S dicluster domain-containing protein [Eggerthellaceae bacterium]|jgi:heterodisulfide reductase subunit C|nr:4Fe-4S dicluster domain-containing protein [Eggerthellaceae bacterium]